MKVVTGDQMRQLEQRAVDRGMPWQALMQNAGRAIADAIVARVGDPRGQKVLILVGPGNNGGDGLVVARHLHDAGALVSLYLWNRQTEADINIELATDRGIPITLAEQDPGFGRLRDQAFLADVVVDSLLGTGHARPIGGTLAGILTTLREVRAPRHTVVAVDLPTGLNADDGSIDPHALPADLTVTLGCPKIGLLLPPGNAFVGTLVVGDIGIPVAAMADITVQMTEAGDVAGWLPERSPIGNKGTFGKVLVVAGSRHFVGATYLVGASAIRVGAGLVTMAVPQSIHPVVAGNLIEATYLPLPSGTEGEIAASASADVVAALPGYAVLALGPGLGQRPETHQFVRHLLASAGRDPRFSSLRWLIDADGLNNLVAIAEWWRYVPDSTVITPHPAELGRLLGIGVADVQRDRLGAARDAARRWGKIVVLKGANTVIAAPDGRAFFNPGVTAALATAGTGDVLAGAIAGLLAQGVEPFEAAVAGVYLHWQAAVAVTGGRSDAIIAAGDLVDSLPEVITALRAT